MLKAIRKWVRGFFAKVLLVLLILSFAVWGIEDMLRFGGIKGAPATVGGLEISRNAFENAYNRELNRLRQQLGTKYTAEIPRLLQVDRRVIDELVMQEMIALETRELGLEVTDDIIADKISMMPAFQDEEGHFDKNLYFSALSNNGMNEQSFVASMRQQIATGLLLETIGAASPVNPLMDKIVADAYGEERTASIAKLTPAIIKDVKAPSEEVLKEFYTQHASKFSLPEYRTVRYFTINEYRLFKDIKVAEDDVKALYDERKEMFGGTDVAPYEEVRDSIANELKRERLDDVVNNFSVKIDDMMAGGATFDEMAKEMNLTLVSVGPFDRNGMDKSGNKVELPHFVSFIDTAFNTEEQYESTLQSGKDNEFYMVFVDRVEDSSVPAFAAIKGKVAEAWKHVEKLKLLRDHADELAKEAANSDAPKKALSAAGAEMVFSGPLTRESVKTNGNLAMPAPLVHELFTLLPGEVSKSYQGEGDMFLIGVMEKRIPPEEASKKQDPEIIASQLEANGREELLSEYLAYLRQKYHVEINQPLLDEYAGREQ